MNKKNIYIISLITFVALYSGSVLAAGYQEVKGLVQEMTSEEITINSNGSILKLNLDGDARKKAKSLKKGDYVKVEYLLNAKKITLQNEESTRDQQPGTAAPLESPKPVLDDRAFYPA